MSLCACASIVMDLDFKNCENLCTKSALPSQIVMIWGVVDIFQISDRCFVSFFAKEDHIRSHNMSLSMSEIVNLSLVVATRTPPNTELLDYPEYMKYSQQCFSTRVLSELRKQVSHI